MIEFTDLPDFPHVADGTRRPRTSSRRRGCALAAVLAGAGAIGAANAAAPDPALLGCWRTQQVHATWSDGSTVESASNCVTEFDADVVHSRCRTPTGVTDTALAYDVPAPGRLRWHPALAAPAASAAPAAAPANAAPPGTGTEAAYVVDGDFVVTTRTPTTDLGGHEPQPKQIQVLSIRVDPRARSGCQPREPSSLRIGRSPRSSLLLTLPAGWRAQLVDPESTPGLSESIGTDFFIGAFVPRAPASAGAAASSASAASEAASPPPTTSSSGPVVIVLDVTRFGASPVRDPEFATLKRDLVGRLPDAEVTCDTPERGCYLMRTARGALGYTELVHVAGRAAIVSAVGARVGALPSEALVRAVQAFSERLLRDNR